MLKLYLNLSFQKFSFKKTDSGWAELCAGLAYSALLRHNINVTNFKVLNFPNFSQNVLGISKTLELFVQIHSSHQIDLKK